jgi:hypothetical protein
MLSQSYLSASNKKSHREYCNKFFLLQSQLPTVTDHNTIRYDISGLRVGRLYRRCSRDPPILSKSFINSSRNMHDQKSCTIGCWKHSRSQKRLQTLATYTGPRTSNIKTANNPKSIEQICRRFETGGSLGRRVNVVACPSPDGSSARASAKGGERGGRSPV